ncbi:MAG: adenosylmethionine--8-amino-7-oxononanoate transaminase [Verrucomicrobia bacterium GWC2_42_7]|nr:MAG: adenosylmethionine--8-amino-7-oxononanoate transaminase [Verrucomicrobia bacterium GWC2_42_7]
MKSNFTTIDKDHSWHPFTQMREYLGQPLLHVERGDGCWLIDTEGKRYLDCNASIWANVHGHNNQEPNDAIVSQVQKLSHATMLGLNHTAATELTERLVRLVPGLQRVFLTDNGATAIEVALKMSFQYWQLVGKPEKTGVIAMEDGYHGDTFGTMAVGGRSIFHSRFNHWLFPVKHISRPLFSECDGVIKEDDSLAINGLKSLLEKHADTTACLIFEPSIQGAAGMQLLPESFEKKARELCDKFGVHLILDEIFVGCGRTGSMTVCGQQGVSPDFLCLSKGLSGGYLPIGATLTSNAIFEPFLGSYTEYKTLFHGHTFGGNPLACAVSSKSLEMIETLISSQKLSSTINFFKKTALETFGKNPFVKEIRQRGMTLAIDLFPGKEGETFPPNDRIAFKICIEARNHGLIIRPLGDSILVVPPLVISNDEISFLFNSLSKSILSKIGR